MELISQSSEISQVDDVNNINPFNKVNKLITKNIVQNILKRYGIFQNITNLDLYQDAMTHDSYTIGKIKEICVRDNVKLGKVPDGCVLLRERSYERLEFLGDAVIENIIVSYLYRRFPEQQEGFLSSMKVNYVNRITLGHLAKVLGLHDYLIVSRTLDDMQHVREEDKVLCDIFEAFIAAIYLDFNVDTFGKINNFLSGTGFQIAELFLINLIEDETSQLDITTFILDDCNYKGKIVKLIKRLYKSNTEFKVVKNDVTKTGENIITVQLIIKNPQNAQNIINTQKMLDNTKLLILAEGKGQTIKKAEHDASKKALINLGYFMGK